MLRNGIMLLSLDIKMELTMYLRLAWLACVWLALLATITRGRDLWWHLYLVSTALVGLVYVPEIPGWADVFWPLLLASVVLRGAACMEAIHHQTKDFPWWSRLTAAAMLAAFFYTAILWKYEGGTIRQVIVKWKMFASIWTACYWLAVWLFLWSVAWLPALKDILTMARGDKPIPEIPTRAARYEDCHSAIVGLLCLRQAIVSVMYLGGPLGVERWVTIDQTATVVDSLLLLASCFLPWSQTDRSEQPHWKSATSTDRIPS